MIRPVSLIIVTHNSEHVLSLCLNAIAAQTCPPDHIILVDSGSRDTRYLAGLSEHEKLTVLLHPNVGFAKANNLGLECLSGITSGMVVFLNPDTFLDKEALAAASATLEEFPEVAVVGGRLSGYDPVARQATGRIDSTGIFRKWYGRWYDHG